MSLKNDTPGVAYYLIQHSYTDKLDGGWTATNLEHVLFEGLTPEERISPLADEYRDLIRPQNASSFLWQKYSIYGYAEREDAEACLAALNKRPRDRMVFRLVRRFVSQRTEVVESAGVDPKLLELAAEIVDLCDDDRDLDVQELRVAKLLDSRFKLYVLLDAEEVQA